MGCFKRPMRREDLNQVTEQILEACTVPGQLLLSWDRPIADMGMRLVQPCSHDQLYYIETQGDPIHWGELISRDKTEQTSLLSK